MSKNSHHQRNNGFSFASRLTEELRITEKKQKKMIFGEETNSNANVSKLCRQRKKIQKRCFGFIVIIGIGVDEENAINCRHLVTSSNEERKKNRNLETYLDFKILQRRRNFVHSPIPFTEDKKNGDESWFSNTSTSALMSSASNTMLVIFFQMSPTTSTFWFQRSSRKQRILHRHQMFFFSRTSIIQ